VRLQWDPDHDPHGRSLERCAIQLGLRGNMLKRFGQEEIMQIMDITEFVKEQSEHVDKEAEQLMTPTEAVYVPSSLQAHTNIKLDTSIH
jgi:Domain of unknown function (DUF4291)